MENVRRWYVYLISALSLQAVTWAVIALARNMLIPQLNPPTTALAFEIAVVIIGLPIFLAHWLWAQRLAERGVAERGAVIRRLYLYVMKGAFLAPFAVNSFGLIGLLLGVDSVRRNQTAGLTDLGSGLVYHLIPLVVLAVLWFYHHLAISIDRRVIPDNRDLALIRRWYVLLFSAAGLVLTTVAISQTSLWLMRQFGSSGGTPLTNSGLLLEVTRLLVGLPMWLIFWRWAQRLFNSDQTTERESALRKAYLYLTIFIGALGTVASATAILAGLFRKLLSLQTQGDIREPIALIIGLGLVWAYHSFVLQEDAREIQEVPLQAGVRRLYLYLVAGIGLAALLVGVGGDLSVIIQALDNSLNTPLREQLAWFTAALIAGLPVWLLPWQQAQARATTGDEPGAETQRSLVRRIYLYFFLFIATVTVLGSAVFIVFKVLSWVLGADLLSLSELGQAIAFMLVAATVWLYHGSTLRTDGRRADRFQAGRLESLEIAIVDLPGGTFGAAVSDALQQEIPGLTLTSIELSSPPEPAAGRPDPETELVTRLEQAGIIIGPWSLVMAGGSVPERLAQAIQRSSARKLLAPQPLEGWDWVGVDPMGQQELVRQTVQALKQIAKGEPVRPVRPLSLGNTVLIGLGIFVLLILLVIPVLAFFSS